MQSNNAAISKQQAYEVLLSVLQQALGSGLFKDFGTLDTARTCLEVLKTEPPAAPPAQLPLSEHT